MERNEEANNYVFVFYNPLSGNRQGNHLKGYVSQYMRLKKDHLTQIQLYNLLDKEECSTGVNYLKNVYVDARNKGEEILEKKKFFIFSAGGDGTFVGVLEKMMVIGLDIQSDIFQYSVFPFGTGNDLPQALGWERTIHKFHTKSFERFSKHITARMEGVSSKMDIWRVSLGTREAGIVETSHGKNKESKRTMERLMSNYMSLGLQGTVGKAFEERRHQSRICNIGEYAAQSLKQGILKRVERVPEFIAKIVDKDGCEYTMIPGQTDRFVELCIQNIAGIWGRQVALWDNCRLKRCVVIRGNNEPNVWGRSSLNDGKLDLFCIKSRFDYLMKQMPITRGSWLGRIGQFPDTFTIHFKENSKFHMMIDGEFYYVQNADTMTIELVSQINILANGGTVVA